VSISVTLHFFLEAMPTTAQKINLLDLDLPDLENWIVAQGYKRFHARQLLKWIHKHGVTDFDRMTDLSKALRAQLRETAEVRVPEVILEQPSSDGTRKWVLQLDGHNRIETVLIPDHTGRRNTLCVSSQVGCALECRFCSTARQGFNRNLSVAEIIGQVWIAARRLGERPLTNVVMMGMGEPLANFDNVVKAMNLMQYELAYSLSKHRVTLSTSGVVPALYRLKEVSDVCLAVSLHAPDDALRNELVPINRKYPIAELLEACRYYIEGDKRRKVTFEYVMIDGVNDSDQQARALVRLLSRVPSKINLIPFNPFPGTDYRCSSPRRMEQFSQILIKAGFVTTLRKTRGDDIDAACGQLVGQVRDRSRRQLVGLKSGARG